MWHGRNAMMVRWSDGQMTRAREHEEQANGWVDRRNSLQVTRISIIPPWPSVSSDSILPPHERGSRSTASTDRILSARYSRLLGAGFDIAKSGHHKASLEQKAHHLAVPRSLPLLPSHKKFVQTRAPLQIINLYHGNRSVQPLGRHGYG